MIALIKFEHDLILPKEEAVSLNLQYTEVGIDEIGFRIDNPKVLRKLTKNYNHFIDELTKLDDGTYHLGDKEIDTYRIYERVSSTNISYVEVASDKQLVNLLEFAPKCNYPYSIVKTVNPAITDNAAYVALFAELSNSLTRIEKTVENSSYVNEVCNVHVPGGALLQYNDLLLCEDSCTDIIQQNLNNGWRIIVVCPQPNQRRPDYILGRFNPDIETKGKAPKEL